MYKEKELIIPLYKTIVRSHLSRIFYISMKAISQNDTETQVYQLRNASKRIRFNKTTRLSHDQTDVFKILNGYENIDRNIYFLVKEERMTRGHGVTIAKKQCIRQFSFS